jgi:(p)ppGpp synthase/HD superfamily hydrolase
MAACGAGELLAAHVTGDQLPHYAPAFALERYQNPEYQELLATLAECCRPVPGDEIVGYVTRGRGVSVHATACPNVRNLLFDPARDIEVEWQSAKDSSFLVDLEIRTEDRPGMLAKIPSHLRSQLQHPFDRGADLSRRHGVIEK